MVRWLFIFKKICWHSDLRQIREAVINL
uniref:Uncharacterized protein n=1 Tax=Anguilla anguilla TaxID=7936 RepID=A0A0E9T292_ANGAN